MANFIQILKKTFRSHFSHIFLEFFWFQWDASSSGLQSPQTQFTSLGPTFPPPPPQDEDRSYGGGAVPSSSEKKKKRNWRKTLSFEVFLLVAVVCVAASSSVVRRRQPLRHRFCRAMIFLCRGAWHVPVTVDLRLSILCFRSSFFSASFELIGDRNTHRLLCEED